MDTPNSKQTLAELTREPQSITETGLNPGLIYDLALKTIYFSGELSGQAVANLIKLPYSNIVDHVLAYLLKEYWVATTGSTGLGERSYNYVITQKGSAKAQEVIERSQYFGPAPVPLDRYNQVVRAQTIGDVKFSKAMVQQNFSHLVVSDAMLRRIGPAANSARSIFLYGPPGNGKTLIAETLASLFKGTVNIPYAVEVDGQVIQVFDPMSHVQIEEQTPQVDARWVQCKRPFIVTGGELTLESLDLIMDPISKIYQAPHQMTANGGMFLIDDFGRQLVRPRDLLNRWIVPLEKRVDYLTLQTGKKIEITFDVLIVFSTNLNPNDLVDDAFLRRIRHKIPVLNPTWDEFKEIFRRVAAARQVPYDEEIFKYLVLEHYIKAKREPKSVHPRDLLDQILDLAKYLDVEPRMTKELIDAAIEAYFVKL